MFRLEKDLNIPLIATNDCHYIAADDAARARDSALRADRGLDERSQALQVRHAGVLHQVRRGDGAALRACARSRAARTMQFAERCNLKLTKVDNPFPEFAVPEGETIDSYFEQVCREGLQEAAARPRSRTCAIAGMLRKTIAEYEARLEREIDCIKQMKFPGYFMIVWDFIRYAKEQDIPVGPGRGSAAGSLVAYVMEITDIDPLQNELLFERFLNPERVSMPDIDIDFCMNRRGEVIDYVTQQVRPRPGRADHHLQHHGGEGGDQGRRPRAGHAVRRGRPHRQDDPADHRHHHRAGAEGLAAAAAGVRHRSARSRS